MPDITRLRQVALVAWELEPVADQLRSELGLGEPFRDPGVGEFGLHNVVFAIGDTFLEVVSPVREGTTAGRYLDRLGGDGGYMAIFQVPDTGAARERISALGVRVVWQIDLGDMSGTHLHPKDVPGAIVSFDTPEPSGSWRWAGPEWTARVPDHGPGGIAGITVEASPAAEVAARWADVLGGAPADVDFRDGDRGITEVRVAGAGIDKVEICGVTFVGEET